MSLEIKVMSEAKKLPKKSYFRKGWCTWKC